MRPSISRDSILASTGFAALFFSGIVLTAEAETEDKWFGVIEENIDKGELYDLDIAIPAAPGLALSGRKAFDDIDHALGADLAYDFGLSDNGTLDLGVSVRPYWAWNQNFERSTVVPNKGRFNWLKNTQISVGLSPEKDGDKEKLNAGLGVVFYPISTADPRQSNDVQTCVTTQISKSAELLRREYSTTLDNLTEVQFNELLREMKFDDVVVDREYKRYLSENAFRYQPRSRRNIVDYILKEFDRTAKRIEGFDAAKRDRFENELNLELDEFEENLVMSDREVKSFIKGHMSLFDNVSNEMIDQYSLLEFSNSPYRVGVELEKFLILQGIESDSREAIIATVLSDDRWVFIKSGGANIVDFVRAVLGRAGVESPNDFVFPPPTREDQLRSIVSMANASGALSENQKLEIRQAFDAYIHDMAFDHVSDDWINDLFLRKAITFKSKLPTKGTTWRDSMDKYLKKMGEQSETLNLSGVRQKIRFHLDDSVNNLTPESFQAEADKEAKKVNDRCRKVATEAYRFSRELAIGIGQSATADDGRVENLKANGTTIWAGYRIPFGRVERKVSDGTEAYPIGSFNLFARYIENESIDLENDATEKADTQIYAVTYAAERKSYKVKLGWSHNINNFVNSALQDEEFERFSAGYDHRLSDKIWFEVEYATTSGKELLEDEDVIRVGFRLK